jgi:hypothetical protein
MFDHISAFVDRWEIGRKALLITFAVSSFVIIASASAYLHLLRRPIISISVSGEGEPSPIQIGWGEQVLPFTLVNDSKTALHIERLEVGFDARPPEFTLLSDSTYSATIVQYESSESPYSLHFSSIPELSAKQDLRTALTYTAFESTRPFTLHFLAEATIGDSYFSRPRWRWFHQAVRRPRTIVKRSVTYRPSGRGEAILTAPYNSHAFKPFGPLAKAGMYFLTNNPNDNTEITCRGLDEHHNPVVHRTRPVLTRTCN